uniref:Uncharacterized protein n=1 Tax=Moniliophthora roreri TaxID=221103 RepID=A0A0W0FA62_MONRR
MTSTIYRNKPGNKHSHKGSQGPHNGTKKAKPTQSQQCRAELIEKVSGESGTQKWMKASALQADCLYEECPKYYQPTKPTPPSQDDDMEVPPSQPQPLSGNQEGSWRGFMQSSV